MKNDARRQTVSGPGDRVLREWGRMHSLFFFPVVDAVVLLWPSRVHGEGRRVAVVLRLPLWRNDMSGGYWHHNKGFPASVLAAAPQLWTSDDGRTM